MKKSECIAFRIMKRFKDELWQPPTRQQFYHLLKYKELFNQPIWDLAEANSYGNLVLYFDYFGDLYGRTLHGYSSNNQVSGKNTERKNRVRQKAIDKLIFSVEKRMLVNLNKPEGIIHIKPLMGSYYRKTVGLYLRKRGVYFLYNKNVLVYVGSSENIALRLKSHLFGKIIEFDSFNAMVFPEMTMSEIRVIEYYCINYTLPIHNKKIKP